MDTTRILSITDTPFNGKAVVYVMSRDQRVRDNHALLTACAVAQQHDVPVIVLFVLRHTGVRRREHYQFMMTGLKEVAKNLTTHNISFVLRIGDPLQEIPDVLRTTQAGMVIFDFSPLVHARKLAKNIATITPITTWVVDAHNVIPAWVASQKKEFAAHTMRTKVRTYFEQYALEPAIIESQTFAPKTTITSSSFEEAEAFIHTIPDNGIVIGCKPGEAAAKAHLAQFLKTQLSTYGTLRNDIADDHQSKLSPYLHFGHISSLRVVLDTLAHTGGRPLLFDEARLAHAGDEPSETDGMNALFEEMIVRKELADNFCLYEPNYRSLTAGPSWAQASLDAHRKDVREFVYTRKQLEVAATHDQSWNAAQNQLRKTGKIHGYMRMYWAKKILEWSTTPEQALKDCIYLNDAYSIDGGDPNGYVGILWSIVGVHDRPWFERAIFGKVRYMNEQGLMRKYDVRAYHKQWNG